MSNDYTGIRRLLASDAAAGRRCAERLLAMRRTLAPVRNRKSDGTLLLATWNIRDFDNNKFGFGPRLPETFFYIAEVIACFDLVAVQEVARDLSALERVIDILGREWDYIVTDTTEGRGGNAERMAFVYHTEKVWFRKIAGEIVLPEGQMIVSRKRLWSEADGPTADATTSPEATAAPGTAMKETRQQFARTPFMVAFQSGWFRFNLCTVHIYYGSERGEALKRRIAEIEALVRFFADRQDQDAKRAAKPTKADKAAGRMARTVDNYILLGDFNVVSPEHETMRALKSHGFSVPSQIDGRKVRDEDDHFYDQIATRVLDARFEVTRGGIVDIFADVFRDTPEDRALYAAHLPDNDRETDPTHRATTPDALYRKWRTWQMSDHKPLWIEIKTDFADDYLSGLATPEA